MSDKPITFAELTAEERDTVMLWRELTKEERIMFLLEFMTWLVYDRNQEAQIDSAA